MGIVVLFIAILPLLGGGAAQLAESELPGPKGERITARVRDTAKILWQLYMGFSLLEIITLLIAGLPFFDAIVTMLGTMPTGGFHLKNLSIAAYDSVFVEGIVTFFMVIAGANFQLYYYIFWKRGFKRFFADREFLTYIGILIAATLLISSDLISNLGYSLSSALRFASFQAVSIQTTTGFATADFALWPSLSRSILLVLMIIGGSAFSTGGGLKVIRIVVLVKYIYRQLFLSFNPRAVQPMKLAGKVLGEKTISDIVGLSLLYFLALGIGLLVMSALGLEPLTAFSAVAATLGNVGPGLGAVGPVANYAQVPEIGKIVLSVLMLIGRLELWTVLAILTPALWRAR